MLASSTIQYGDELSNGAMYSVGGFSGKEVIFTKYPVTAGKPTEERGCFII